MHSRLAAQSTAIRCWPPGTVSGRHFPVAGSPLNARPRESTATHSVLDGHATEVSQCPQSIAGQMPPLAPQRTAVQRVSAGHASPETDASDHAGNSLTGADPSASTG
jgi:hypothetical protein